jgi:hypothetical protein
VSRACTRFSCPDVIVDRIFECLAITAVTCSKEDFVVCKLSNICMFFLSISLLGGFNITISTTVLESPLRLQWE